MGGIPLLYPLQFTEAFSKYGISDVPNGSVLVVEIADANSSKMDEISKMIQGDLTDLNRLSQLADTETSPAPVVLKWRTLLI